MRLLIALPIVLAGQAASAGPQLAWNGGGDGGHHETSEESWRWRRAVFEWSTWVRLGAGVASTSSDVIAKGDASPDVVEHAFEAGLGADVSLPFGRRFRMGVWGELQNLEPVGGVELVFTKMPRRLDMFQFLGGGVLAGVGPVVTAAASRGAIAACVRSAAARTRRAYETASSREDARGWRATVGVEFEPRAQCAHSYGPLEHIIP